MPIAKSHAENNCREDAVNNRTYCFAAYFNFRRTRHFPADYYHCNKYHRAYHQHHKNNKIFFMTIPSIQDVKMQQTFSSSAA